MSEGLRLYNTLTRTKEAFAPIDPDNVRMYVCGPTVYDFAHIGNARPVIVFDVLYRLLRHLYGEDHVTYVRNITDVDDKINARALRDYPDLPLNEAIRKVTEKTANQFHEDVAALGCLEPTFEPRATEFVLPRPDGKADMVGLIQSLIDRGHAYEAKGESGREILFDTTSMRDYGQLSKRNLDEQQAGARVAVEAHKKHPADFVLWKESSPDEPGWDATFRVSGKDIAIRGRPGWHIECSAMSAAYLGEVFDIHGGGLDLIFPHHENEIAQSRCAHGTDVMANVWMHNGYLQVEGKKMSKSEGNFVTIHDLLHTEKFGGRKWPGEVLRLAMLMTHYREPIDFSVRRLNEAEQTLNRWADFLLSNSETAHLFSGFEMKINESALVPLAGDLNTPWAIATANQIAKNSQTAAELEEFCGILELLGFSPEALNRQRMVEETMSSYRDTNIQMGGIKGMIQEILTADNIDEASSYFRELGVEELAFDAAIELVIDYRQSLIREKNWAEADKIRDELLAQGIQLKDGKDPETGERVTTWEVKR